MGYQRSILKLTWAEGSEFHGLEVKMKRLSIKQLLKVEKLRDLNKPSEADKTTEETLGELLDTVAVGLIGWNLEVEQEDLETGDITNVAVPATRETLDDQDADLILSLVSAWIEAAASVPLASKRTSAPGEPELPSEPPLEEWAALVEAESQETLPEPASF